MKSDQKALEPQSIRQTVRIELCGASDSEEESEDDARHQTGQERKSENVPLHTKSVTGAGFGIVKSPDDSVMHGEWKVILRSFLTRNIRAHERMDAHFLILPLLFLVLSLTTPMQNQSNILILIYSMKHSNFWQRC